MKEPPANINTSLATSGHDGQASHGNPATAILLQYNDKVRIGGIDDDGGG